MVNSLIKIIIKIAEKKKIIVAYETLASFGIISTFTFGKKMLSLFGSTYVCEKPFLVMNLNKSRVRARLSDSHKTSCASILLP